MSTGAPPGAVLVVRVPALVEAIPYLRLVLRRVLPELPESEASLYYGAVTEVLTNAMAAQRISDRDEPVVVEVHLRPRPMVVVCDRGGGFHPSSFLPATHGCVEVEDPLHDTRRAGLGLRIARSVCPDMEIVSGPGGTTVRIPHPRTGERADGCDT